MTGPLIGRSGPGDVRSGARRAPQTEVDFAERRGRTWQQREPDTVVRQATCARSRDWRTVRMVGARMCMTVGVDDVSRCRKALGRCHHIVALRELRRLNSRQMHQARQYDERDDQEMMDRGSGHRYGRLSSDCHFATVNAPFLANENRRDNSPRLPAKTAPVRMRPAHDCFVAIRPCAVVRHVSRFSECGDGSSWRAVPG